MWFRPFHWKWFKCQKNHSERSGLPRLDYQLLFGKWARAPPPKGRASRSNTVGFWFSSRASSGPFGWIFDWKVLEESWIFWPLCYEVWKESDAILRGKMAPALEPFQNKVSSLVLLLGNFKLTTATPRTTPSKKWIEVLLPNFESK